MKQITLIGAGFLGSALALGAARRGWDTTVIGRSDPFAIQNTDPGPGEIRLLTGDGVELLPETLQQDVDAIIITAGGHFPLPSAAAPAADAIGTLSLVIGLCETVRSLSPQTKIVFLSSAGAVYAPSDELKYESDPGEPTSPYGMSRRVGEEYMEYYRRVHGLSTHSLRCVNVYGRLLPRSRGQGVVSAAFWSALTGKPFTLHGDGRQTRDFIHVDDFVTATLNLLESGRDLPGTINVGTGVGSSIANVLDAVGAATGSTIATAPGPSAHTDTGNLAVDLSLLRNIIEFEPLDLDAGIKLMAREIAACGPLESL
ncbi:NAD-dependent epimerase/dehydratase family protein [Streptomyces coacervatus]|uniref:NAD-dependent epimerase/dehydratase family protein n=1 Tax=Streptomyces coacervatus TaxID=647381 RepID=A0ABP7H3M1_9ACTN|nr:NAD-dependent epimerase/dehydratase family protein [Streptomyces coacervatus]MDF2271586.1 NAD-dependent epimerase/dehydratase family protein [Streptomyces coacervatus]